MMPTLVQKTVFSRSGSPFPRPTVTYRLMEEVTVFMTIMNMVRTPPTAV